MVYIEVIQGYEKEIEPTMLFSASCYLPDESFNAVLADTCHSSDNSSFPMFGAPD